MIDYEQVEILLVEDSETDAEMTMRALGSKNLANNLVWVKDGAEALDFLFRRGIYASRPNASPKLVLLDLKMPKVDGIEVLRQIKADERTRAIPVVMLTSSAEERQAVPGENHCSICLGSVIARHTRSRGAAIQMLRSMASLPGAARR